MVGSFDFLEGFCEIYLLTDFPIPPTKDGLRLTVLLL